MIRLEISQKCDSKWNENLLKSGLGTIFQTEERGKFLEINNNQVYFLKFFNSNEILVGQLLVNKINRFDSKNLKSKFLKNLPRLKNNILNWTYGPIIFDINYSDEIYVELNKFINSEKAVPNAWTHPIQPGNPIILKKNLQVIPWGTYMINLNHSPEEIYKKIDKSNARKNIERSIKRGVEIEEITEKTLDDFFDLVLESRTFSVDQEHERKMLHKRWKIFKPLGFSGFLAKRSETYVGGLMFSYVNGHIIESGVARSTMDTQEKLYSQDLIKWKIIEWGSLNKMKFFNLAGFNPNPKTNKEQGIQQYKKKWGGDEFYFHRLLSNPVPWKKISN